MRHRPRRHGWPTALAGLALALTATAACSSSPDPGGDPAPDPTTTAPVPTEPGAEPERWQPQAGATWQWQLDGQEIDTSVDAEVYDVDLFETPVGTIDELHDQGRHVVCYFTAGTWEPYRSDSGDLPESVMGGPVDGWPDERWLDIRQLDVLRPWLEARLDLCAEKGFDAAEPDWMDNHVQDTGFDITAEDQLAFNRMLAELGHERGLAVGLKNDPDQAGELADELDFAVVEQCAQYDECEQFSPFVEAGKPVFVAEYELTTEEFCPVTEELGMSGIRKRLELDPWREVC